METILKLNSMSKLWLFFLKVPCFKNVSAVLCKHASPEIPMACKDSIKSMFQKLNYGVELTEGMKYCICPGVQGKAVSSNLLNGSKHVISISESALS